MNRWEVFDARDGLPKVTVPGQWLARLLCRLHWRAGHPAVDYARPGQGWLYPPGTTFDHWPIPANLALRGGVFGDQAPEPYDDNEAGDRWAAEQDRLEAEQ